MPQSYYSEICLHLTWHTKQSLPLLTPDVEGLTYRFLRHRIVETKGVFLHEIGGTETHVHLAVRIPPTLLLSDFIGQLKGASTHEVNQQLAHRGKVLQWHRGYGVVSFGQGNLEWVTRYIREQRLHHQRGTFEDRLERIAAMEEEPR